MKLKRIIAAVLSAVTLLGIMPFAAYAANWGEGDTLDDALSQLKVGFDDTLLDWLVLPNLGTINLRYTYFQYKNERTGTIDEQPVYCIDPTKGGAYEIVAAIGPNNDGSRTATYIRGEKVGDAKYKAILAAGYPHMRLTGLGLETIEEGYYATKLALWMYIRGNDPSKLTINPKYGGSDPVALRVRAAAVKIYTTGTNSSGIREPSLTMTGKPSATANLDANGEYYVQGVEIIASGWVGTNPDACGDVQLSWDSPPPAGTIVLGSDGEDITSTMNVKMGSGANGWTGKVTIKYPASGIDAETFTPPTLKAKAIVPNDGIYVAYAEAGKDKYQRYLVESDPKIELTASFVSQVSAPEPFPEDSGLRIRKLETGTSIPLEGAVFEIRDPDGKLIYSMATDASGIIDIPLYASGNYTVTEITPPQYHMLPENRTQSVTVRYGEVAEVTFTNAPFGTLRVVKRDAANGMPLGGAAVRIRNITTNTTREMRTDSSGSAVFEKLPVGAYEIVEITAPDGYALDSSAHTVNVVPLSEGETSYTLTNKANPGLRITKFDRQTMTPIAGVTFEVWRDGELYGSYVTDAWGEIELRNLPAGTYTAREVATVEPYVLDPTAQWIEIKAGQGYISELVFFNLTKPGIHLVKVDSGTFAPLVNARFLIKQVSGSYAKEFTTDVNGEIDLTGLDPGAYTVEEITAPDGYLIDDAIRTIQINAGENAQFVFTDTQKPGLEIVKYDPVADRYLGGATFRIAKIEDGSHYLDRITDTNGKITIDGLEPGIYSVQEIAAPSGYVINGTEYHVELFPGRVSQLVVVNEKKPDLKIIKTDAVTGKPVAGVTFKVNKAEKAGSGTLTTVTTDANGEALLTALDPGIYQVTEQSVPDGYLLDGTPQFITLFPNKTGVVQFQNYPKPTLTINKVDSITGDPIKGALFRVTYASNNTFTGEINDLGTYYTDENGQIVLEKLTDGWYRITELEPAAGYAIKDPAAQDIYVKAGESKTVIFENTPLNSIIIKKVDADTGEVLQGAKFRLSYLSGTSGTSGTVIGEYTTSANGTVTITGLAAGTYQVQEIQAPDGYEITEASKTVYITENEQAVITVEFADKKHSGLLIKKVDSVTGAALPGAVFKITDSSGAVVGTANGEYTTDANGLIQISNLSAGTYLVTEVKAPDGYVLDKETKSIQVKNDGGVYTLTFSNTPEGGLQIRKSDEETGKAISGVEFEVRKMNGEIIGHYTTDSKGMIRLPNLDAGWYTVIETKAAKGYLLDSTARNVEIKEGQTKVLTVTNRQASSVLIHKVDSVTGKGIYGVVFLLYDARMNPIGRYTSDQNGFVYVDKTLEDGKYHAQEIEAADGYILDNTIKTFYIEYGATSTITWKNTPEKAQIQIVKYASDYNSVTGAPAGSLLKGAVFEISQARSGKVVGYITTDARGVAASEPLPLGRYIVKEVTAPPYYQLSGEPFDVTLEYSGQIIRLSAYNKSASLGTEIKKVGNQEIIAGDRMRYDISLANTSNVPLSDFYWSDRIPTDAARAQTLTTGTYNQRLYYRVLYKTNAGEWRVLASNLLSTNNYAFNLSAAALGLGGGEVITNIKFEFGTVQAGFASVTKPTITVQTLSTLASGYQIINRCEVGGQYGGAWQTSTAAWVTKVVRYGPSPSLPKTGY